MKKSMILALFLIALVLLLTACSPRPISEIKNEIYIGKSVTVRGVVGISIKIGKLSGYTVSDSTGSIGVRSNVLPLEGTEVSVTGTLTKDTLLGYYILASR